MHKFFILGLVILCIATACKRLPDIQGHGEEFFQGVWAQDSMPNDEMLLNYTQHKFKISCDSFYVDLVTHSKVNYYSDACFNNGLWREYAKGVYEVRHDTIFFTGTYTKSNYKQKITGCYQIGQYLKSFKILNTGRDTLTLENTANQRIVKLILREKILCVPKAL
ncbi:MAG: fumarate hydratase [Bacteroidota bacterium]